MASNDKFVKGEYEQQQLIVKQQDQHLEDIEQAVTRLGRVGLDIHKVRRGKGEAQGADAARAPRQLVPQLVPPGRLPAGAQLQQAGAQQRAAAPRLPFLQPSQSPDPFTASPGHSQPWP
jgi:hypothetical protein